MDVEIRSLKELPNIFALGMKMTGPLPTHKPLGFSKAKDNSIRKRRQSAKSGKIVPVFLPVPGFPLRTEIGSGR